MPAKISAEELKPARYGVRRACARLDVSADTLGSYIRRGILTDLRAPADRRRGVPLYVPGWEVETLADHGEEEVRRQRVLRDRQRRGRGAK